MYFALVPISPTQNARSQHQRPISTDARLCHVYYIMLVMENTFTIFTVAAAGSNASV